LTSQSDHGRMSLRDPCRTATRISSGHYEAFKKVEDLSLSLPCNCFGCRVPTAMRSALVLTDLFHALLNTCVEGEAPDPTSRLGSEAA
jgi:hypothetical protein